MTNINLNVRAAEMTANAAKAIATAAVASETKGVYTVYRLEHRTGYNELIAIIKTDSRGTAKSVYDFMRQYDETITAKFTPAGEYFDEPVDFSEPETVDTPMTKDEYLDQYANMDDYMAAIRKDWKDEMGTDMPSDAAFLAYKIGLERYEPQRYQRIFCD